MNNITIPARNVSQPQIFRQVLTVSKYIKHKLTEFKWQNDKPTVLVEINTVTDKTSKQKSI